MEYPTQMEHGAGEQPAAAHPDSQILTQIESIGLNMKGWLKFLGILNIVMGAFQALSIVGIIIAWVPIWMGVLLLQAGNKASQAKMLNNRRQLILMMDKLRLYFIIQGVIFLVMIVFAVVGIFMFGTFLEGVLENLPQY
ncbi:MAG: hypothetical protein Kow0037_22270 [Calditrichia bacterium]